MYRWNHNTDGLLCLLFSAYSCQGLSMLKHVSEYYPFLCWIIFCFINILIIHWSLHEHLDSFHFWATINNVAMNMGIQISSQITVFVSFEYIPRSGIAGSYGSSIYNFLRLFHSVSIVVVPIYNPTNKHYFFPIFMLAFFVFFLMKVILTSVRWYLIMV